MAPLPFVVAAANTTGESTVLSEVEGFQVTVASFRYGAAHLMITAPLPPAAPNPGLPPVFPPPPPPPPRPFVPADAGKGAGQYWFHEPLRVLVPQPAPEPGFSLSQFEPGTMSLPPPSPLP